jgi:hypothetical protein
VTKSIKLSLVVCLAGALTSTLVFAQADAHVGTWKLNLAKSTFKPGPPPQSTILTYAADGTGLTVMVQGVDAAGKPINPEKAKVAVNFDGKDHPTPNANYDASAWKRADSNKFEVTRKKDGKVVQSGTNTVSKDGKTMTTSAKGTNASGQSIDNVTVYDKQ